MTTIRPLLPEDVPAVAEVQLAANRVAEEQAGRQWTPPDDTRRARFRRALDRFAAVDAGTSFVAEVDGAVVGHAVAIRRGTFWGLSLLFVHPDHQSAGVGRRLMEAVTPGAEEAQLAMIMSSEDPRAIRRYARAGFDLHPAVEISGTVDRAALPAGLPVRPGGSADLDVVDAVDAQLRGSSRREDVEFLIAEQGARLWIAERGQGFAVGTPNRIVMLGADAPATAQTLLWQMLATAEEDIDAYCWTAAQQWAIDVAVAAKLKITPGGPLFVRGGAGPDRVPVAYLPSGIYF
jgi:predicted N-acetyltransferase YhbS